MSYYGKILSVIRNYTYKKRETFCLSFIGTSNQLNLLNYYDSEVHVTVVICEPNITTLLYYLLLLPNILNVIYKY
jgi:hypothetical protein